MRFSARDNGGNKEESVYPMVLGVICITGLVQYLVAMAEAPDVIAMDMADSAIEAAADSDEE